MLKDGYIVETYQTETGQIPVKNGLKTLDKKAKSIVYNRIDQIIDGNLGDHKYLDKGVYEFRIFLKPGYRIYFSKEDKHIILLLCAGDKDNQGKDLKKAIKYLNDYKTRLT